MGSHRSYREQKFDFGKQLLTLRTRVALTQSELAQAIGVHRRSVQNWETGESYPKADALQRLIAHFLAHRAFNEDKEREEAHALWQQAAADGPQTLPPFDPAWFERLLAANAARPAATPLTSTQSAPIIIDWGEITAPPALHGRAEEIDTLQRWIVDERCRVVTVLGLGGIGKSSLAITFARRVVASFEIALFRSLQNGPPLEQVLDQMIRALSGQQAAVTVSLPDKIALLVQILRERRCLLILDNYETVLQPGTLTGTYRSDYADYSLFLRGLAERGHQSCLLLTSREKPAELGPLEGRTAPVRTLSLTGLADAASQLVLEAKELVGTPGDLHALARLYGGNPLALNLVAEPIIEIFGGDVAAFLATDDAFFNGMSRLLDQQFGRSAPLEQSILYWLAIERELVPLQALLANLDESVQQREVLGALESLRRRMLIERSPNRPAFTLQPVIMEYVTERLVDITHQEIVDGKARLLQSHTLVQATAKDYLRRSQERMLATPLLEQLSRSYGQADLLERQLLQLLESWRGMPLTEQGYGPGNITHLLRLAHGHLRGLNLTRLSLRQAYLQGVEAQDSSLADALLQETLFTESFDALTSVAISPTGEYWVAISRRGEILLWAAEGQSLRRAWQAHSALVWSIVFSPDGTLLASGSWDGTVKVWDIPRGTLLWVGRHKSHVNRVAFSASGKLLASSSSDATVHLWDATTGALLHEIFHPAPVAVVDWSPVEELLASGDMAGVIRLWQVEEGGLVTQKQTLTEHQSWVDGLAFAPDGAMLASASYEGTVKFWEITSGRVVETLTAHMEWVHRLAWSPDGSTLASCSFARTIWLWDVKERNFRLPLQGHVAAVYDLAFTPDSSSLLSGSEDGTLRVWEVDGGQCKRAIQGYVGSLYEVDWSPDGTQLVTIGTDASVTIYSVEDGKPLRVMRGHTNIVFGVGWSANGRWLASGEMDNAILLWDASSGALLETLRHPHDSGNLFYSLAWSPAGASGGERLACGTASYGVMLWDVAARRLVWAGEPLPTKIRQVAWSPDGTRLAGGGDDGTVYVWDSADGTLLQHFAGHESMIMMMAWSPDGRRLAACSSGQEEGKVLVWDAAAGVRVDALAGHPGNVEAVAWGQEDTLGKTLLVSGGGDGKLRWWDIESGECVRTCDGHVGLVQSLKRSPDGSRLASCGDDGAVMIWDSPSGGCLQTLRRDRPYERMDIRGLMGITEAQRASLISLGAIERSQ